MFRCAAAIAKALASRHCFLAPLAGRQAIRRSGKEILPIPRNIMTQSIEEVVIGLIARHKGIAFVDIAPSAELADLGITSLDAITLAYELEEQLGVEIPNAEIESVRTVQDLVDGLIRLTTAKI
jgi:acyl carrier protein